MFIEGPTAGQPQSNVFYLLPRLHRLFMNQNTCLITEGVCGDSAAETSKGLTVIPNTQKVEAREPT